MKMDKNMDETHKIYRNCETDLANIQVVPMRQNVLRDLYSNTFINVNLSEGVFD